MQIKREMDKGGHYNVQMKRWKLKGWMDKVGHYVEVKWWMQKWTL